VSRNSNYVKKGVLTEISDVWLDGREGIVMTDSPLLWSRVS
jgi:hypothetical protein